MEKINSKQSVKKESGFLSFGPLLFILLVLVTVYSSFKIIPFYYSYYELQNIFQAQAEVATMKKDSEIIDIIDRAMKKLEVPADVKDLRIMRVSGKIIIELSYSEVFFIDFGEGYDYDIWEFDFKPRGEARI